MQHKIILIACLIIGISSVILVSSCHTQDKIPIKKAEFVYVNKMADVLSLEVYDDFQERVLAFQIEPNDSITIQSEGEGIAYPFRSQRLGQVKGDRINIKFDNGRCTEYEFDPTQIEGIFDLSNYENYDESVGNSSFYRLAYFIDDKDFELSQMCE